MLINQFNGGLSTRQAPQMLNINEGVVYENIDNSLGTLTPTLGSIVRENETPNYPFWYEAGNKWIFTTGDYEPTVELNGKVYAASPERLTVYSPTSSRAAGVTKPTITLAFAERAPGKIAKATLTPAFSASATALPSTPTYYVLLNRNDLGYSAGLSVVVQPTSRTEIVNRAYSWLPGQQVQLRDYEQVAGRVGGGRQTVTIGPVDAVIEPSFGVDVYRVYKGVHRLVGTLTSTTATLVDSTEDISAQPELESTYFAKLQGVYQYVVTNVNADGIESQPSNVSNEIDLRVGGVAQLVFSTAPFGVTTRRIYRVGGNLTQFTLVAEIPDNEITFEDDITDLEVDGRVLTSQDNAKPPVAMTALVTAYAMLFGADDKTLRFTNPGEPEYWPEAYSIPFPLKITGLAPVANGLLVFTRTSTYLVTGNGPLVLSVQLLSGDQGCIDVRSIQVHKGSAIWATHEGLCVSTGTDVEVVTKDKLGKLTFTDQDLAGNIVSLVVSSVLFNEVYYLSYDGKAILALDFRFGAPIFKTLSFSAATEPLILFRDPSTLFFYTTTQRRIAFSGINKETMRYKSPRFIEGRATENKTYKKIYFYVEGAVIFNVYINDVLVASKTTAADTKDSVTLQIPQPLQRGFFIQFEVIGTGQIYEIEYVAEGRQDG